jgi:hypothetical protein
MRFPERSRPLHLASGLALALAGALAGCDAPVAPAVQYPPQGYPPQPYPPAPQPYPPAPQAYPPAPQAYPPPQAYRPAYPPQPPPQAYPPAPRPPQSYWPPPTATPQASRQASPTPSPAPVAPPAYRLPPAYPPLPAAPAVVDSITSVDLVYLRAKAKSVLDELIAALPPAHQAKVQGVPFITDPAVGEVNAYAACNEKHMPLMAITDGLLQIEAYTAELRATDEIFRTSKLDQYLQVFAKEQQPHQPIVAPPASLLDPVQQVDPRKVARQHEILEELLAFVLGHELGHHYLGHTGCANGQSGDRALTPGDGQRFLTTIPVFGQTLEVDADSVGVDDVLAAGARRPGYHWTEQGALLTLGFFGALEPLTALTPIVTFVDSHPNPAVRVIPIKLEVARYRQTGVWYQPLVPMLP